MPSKPKLFAQDVKADVVEKTVADELGDECPSTKIYRGIYVDVVA